MPQTLVNTVYFGRLRRREAGSRPKDSSQPQRKPRGLECGDARHRVGKTDKNPKPSRSHARRFSIHIGSPKARLHAHERALSTAVITTVVRDVEKLLLAKFAKIKSRLGCPTNDFLGFPRHFLSPKFRLF